MRHVVLLSAGLLLGAASVHAQQVKTKAEFDAYSTSKSKEIRQLITAKQYRPALALYAQWHQATTPWTKPPSRTSGG
ncbi:hypothetical protein [Hymenobacter sp. AT01-02]|uniref:hypothetical protein n=1 Tax=Hymenobacter sp. AT01-02 TaxID=1571877 RepID=UPI00137939B9|nr:hypothetical protein [Hymenobacter sp. AT01-02]